MQALLAAVRGVCSSVIWSRGVQLCRSGAVAAPVRRAGELEIRVVVPPRATFLVSLYPDDKDWSCDCDSPDDACAHVAAAVIALAQGRAQNAAPAVVAPVLIYAFNRLTEGLGLTLMLRQGDQTTPWFEAIKHRPAPPPDRTAHRMQAVLGAHRTGLLSRRVLQSVLAALLESPNVTLDGQPTAVGEALPPLRVKVAGRGGALEVRLIQDPSIRDTFDNGAVLQAGALRPLGEVTLAPTTIARLRHGEILAADNVADFLTTTLPALRAALPVDVAPGVLPNLAQVPPRLRVESSAAPDRPGFFALCTLVYGDPILARVDGDRLHHIQGDVPQRDRRREAALLQQAIAAGVPVGHRILCTNAAAIALANGTLPLHGSAHLPFAQTRTLRPQGHQQGDAFNLDFALPDGSANGRATADAVLRAWQENQSVVQLMDGTYAPLPRDFLRTHGPMLADLLAARAAAEGPVPRAALLDAASLCEAAGVALPDDLRALAHTLAAREQVPPCTLPPDATVTLRDYQRRGTDWLVFLRDHRLGALLADDMGLGKTVQTLCALRGRVLVVAPTSVVHNWLKETQNFRPGLRAHLYHGPQRALDPQADLTLTSYALLRLDVEALAAQVWDVVVLDEAHQIKNPHSQIAAAAFRLQAPCRIALTGTPVENRLEELWSIFHFLNPGYLGSQKSFASRYAGPISQGDSAAAARLAQRLRPFILRRKKGEVVRELPPRTDIVLRCELSEPERAAYDAVRAATRAQVVQALQAGGNVMQALEALLRMRQACCHPALLPGTPALRADVASAKLRVLLDNLAEVCSEGHRALVFSQWTGLLDLVEPHLRQAALRYCRLDGSTPDRQAVVETFAAPDGPHVMLLSLKAGGVGLNLTAADHVFLLDPWWNPAAEDQAADRAHRIGQTRPVMVHRLIAAHTVEERILALQAHKRDLATAALQGTHAATRLSRDDVLALLSD